MMTGRVARLRKASLEAKPSISHERAALVTDAYARTQNAASTPLRRAFVFRHLMENRTIHIGEDELIAERSHLRSTVLKVGHHGSASSTSQPFLNVVDPQVAVVSVGKDNNYAHPNQDVMDRLEERVGPENIYRTDQRGTVEFITNGKRLWVKMAR